MESISNNKRLAKNTLLLYFRMILLMAITLFTSRVVLQTLGVEDYGIYNVVGGFCAMFGILTSSLSTAISRFITVELGKDNIERVRQVFSTSIKVQLALGIVIAILGEAVGYWFMNTQMQIPVGREAAAAWVLHCSILAFIVSLLNVPFNACIVAHEKMSAFAYISILEAVLKLLIVYALLISGFDKLILYAILMFAVQGLLFAIYSLYCKRKFVECNGRTSFDKGLFGEMCKFAGWNFLGNGAAVLNNQGVNMVMNVFYGVVVNAARGISMQVNSAVQQFVSSFMMALNPQITKSYAAGDKQTAYELVCRGSKFSYLIMFMLALPIMLESSQILTLWLGEPPTDADIYVVWTLMATLTIVTGQTLLTLQLAHGDIKKYQIYVTLFGFLPFQLTWIGFAFGASAIWAFQIYFIVYYILIYVRLWLVHDKTGIPYGMFIKDVIIRIHAVTLISVIIPLTVVHLLPSSIGRLILTFAISIAITGVTSYFIGLNETEKGMINRLLIKIKNKIVKLQS